MVRATARRRQGYTHDVEIQGGHRLVIDEPEESGGANQGPSPTRTLAATLAACTAITMEMYAGRKGWELGEVEVEVEMEYGASSVPRSFVVILRLPKGLASDQLERLRVIAGKCPVHRALSHETEVSIEDRVELAFSYRQMDPGRDGKACAITGASRGIGREVARRLCAEGASGPARGPLGADSLAEARRGQCRARRRSERRASPWPST